MPTADPMASLNARFEAAPDYQPSIHGNGSHREGYEPVGEGQEGGGGGGGEQERDSPGLYFALSSNATLNS